MLPTGRRLLIGLSAVFCIGVSSLLATPLPLYTSIEGSTDEEELTNLTQVLHVSNSSNQATPPSPVQVETDFLSQAVSFLEENMLLILVSCSLIILTFLIVCGAVVMSHRRKVNAYYPSSFPSRMYVDQRDKAGGAKLFNEVPEKAAPEQQAEPLDSHKELQAAIMKAAKNLRTPSKAAGDGGAGSPPAVGDHRAEVDSSGQPEGTSEKNQAEGASEENQSAELSGAAGAPAAGGLEINSPPPSTPPPQPQEAESQESGPVRSLRPSSLHIHNDSATLQLIAGEKTAF